MRYCWKDSKVCFDKFKFSNIVKILKNLHQLTMEKHSTVLKALLKVVGPYRSGFYLFREETKGGGSKRKKNRRDGVQKNKINIKGLGVGYCVLWAGSKWLWKIIKNRLCKVDIVYWAYIVNCGYFAAVNIFLFN